MQKYHDTIQDEAGNVVTTATVTVYNANTGTPSSIYDDDEVTPLANPFTIANSNYDINGNIFFKAANGDYDVKVVVGANTAFKYDVKLYDVDDNTNVVKHNFIATTDPTVTDDSNSGYSEGSVWINQTLDDAYRCVDDTVGAAVWIKTTLQSTDLGALAVLNTVNNDQWLGADLSIANGGTGQSTAQAAIDALSQVSGATDEHVLTKDTATGNAVFKAAPGATPEIETITATVAANALTCGTPASSVDFRDATLTSGAVTSIAHGALSLVVPDTATLGTVSAVQSRLYLLKINNAGTVELAIVNSSGGNDLSETGVISTTALSTGSDSANVIYSTTARTNVAYRVVGFIESTQATAGTWATAPSLIQGAGGLSISSGKVIQQVNVTDGAIATGSTTMPVDDTIPKNTEGNEFIAVSITPTSASNKLIIEAQLQVGHSASFAKVAAALFQDSTEDALTASITSMAGSANRESPLNIKYEMTAGTTSSTTFKVRVGSSSAGTATFNGGTGVRNFGGVSNSYIKVTEVSL